jgi:hypothetical protein
MNNKTKQNKKQKTKTNKKNNNNNDPQNCKDVRVESNCKKKYETKD